MKISHLMLAATLAGVCASASQAGVVTSYATLGAFNSAVGAANVTVEDFTSTSHFPITTGILNSSTNLTVGTGPAITPGMIKPGVTYSTPVGSGNFFNIDFGGGFTGGLLDTVTGGNRVLTITFDGPVQFFGFDTNSLVSSMNLTVNFGGGGTFTDTVVPANGLLMDFFGYGSDVADITSLTLSGAGSISFAIDNFRFTDPQQGGNGNNVPEPGSLALAALALAGAGAIRRRRSA